MRALRVILGVTALVGVSACVGSRDRPKTSTPAISKEDADQYFYEQYIHEDPSRAPKYIKVATTLCSDCHIVTEDSVATDSNHPAVHSHESRMGNHNFPQDHPDYRKYRGRQFCNNCHIMDGFRPDALRKTRCLGCHDRNKWSGRDSHSQYENSEACSIACHKNTRRGQTKIHHGSVVGTSSCSLCHTASSGQRGCLKSGCHTKAGGWTTLNMKNCDECHENRPGTSSYVWSDKFPNIFAKGSSQNGECIKCHNPKGKHFHKPEQKDSCDGCHPKGSPIPGQHPVDLQSDQLIGQVPVFGCAVCHEEEGDDETYQIEAERQQSIQADCAKCHKDQNKQCGVESRHSFINNNHPSGCTDCHKPQDSERMHYKGFRDPTVCGTCHGSIGTPHFITEANNCGFCHITKKESHGTALKVALNECLDCHSHAHAASSSNNMSEKSSNSAGETICSGCHIE